MTKPNSFVKEIAKQSASVRVEKAKHLVNKVVDHTLEAIAIQENNAFLVYSKKIAAQIPRSRAAHAFVTLQSSMHRFELVRLTALWDPADIDKASIPSIIALIEDTSVLQAIASETRAVHTEIGWSSTPTPEQVVPQELIDTMLKRSQDAFAEKQAVRAVRILRNTIRRAKVIAEGSQLDSMRHVRDKHIAHSLEKTRRELRSPVKPLKNGDELYILKKTIPLVENLYCWVCGTSFDIAKDSRRLARMRAKELWQNLSFSIPTR